MRDLDLSTLNDKKRFVGTWIGSMMTYMWVYDGELDRSERVLTRTRPAKA
jgi:Protein of unknown function (DUF1579)